MKILPLYIMLCILVGCSSRGVYEGIQASNRYECSKLPPSQYDACMKTTDKSYDEYERERKALINAQDDQNN